MVSVDDIDLSEYYGKSRKSEKILSTLKESIFAGILIGFGGAVYLSVPNRTLGAFLFAFGLLTILIYQQKLYTGAIGYAGKIYGAGTLTLIFLGNLIGTALTGFLLKCSNLSIASNAAALIVKKGDLIRHSWDDPIPVLVAGIFCGILMYLGVDSWRKETLPGAARVLMVILAVALFILCGFEHCIADMFYLFAADHSDIPVGIRSLFVLYVAIGNSAGALGIAALLAKKED
ncbi:MAG: formate/nitrite transporter family protein [Planctomycetia bacterium]|nr:formate/nitrite transporter family protein [Planctomycetia bacterium]